MTGQLDPNEVIVPTRIVRILRAGWTDHIPLDAITNRACRLASSSATRNTDHGLTMGSDGRIISKASPIDHSKEDKIEMAEWYQASRNLVFAIGHFLWAAVMLTTVGVMLKRLLQFFVVISFSFKAVQTSRRHSLCIEIMTSPFVVNTSTAQLTSALAFSSSRFMNR